MVVGFCSFRIVELTDTVKHLRSQNSEKDASLNTMQIGLDRMVGLGVGGWQIDSWLRELFGSILELR